MFKVLDIIFIIAILLRNYHCFFIVNEIERQKVTIKNKKTALTNANAVI